VKIAIVGTGVSGLVCAHRLHPHHDLTVFEAAPRIGGHVNTIEVAPGLAVDTGFIVYNERTYPGFTKLLAELGVETQASDMSFGVRCDRSGLEWASHGLGGVFADPRNLVRPAFLRMLRDLVRFQRDARALLAAGPEEKLTLGDFLAGRGYARELAEHCVVPMGAAIWSAAPERLLDFPAVSFARFFENHGLLSLKGEVRWRVVRGGSARYVEKLVASLSERILTRTPVSAVQRGAGGVDVIAGGRTRRFDRVILAVHSDQALALLDPPSDTERRVLSAIRYQANEAVLHTDARVMPRRRRAWASWNYRIPPEPRAHVQVTYHMNRLQRLDTAEDYFVTLNDDGAIDPARVVRRIAYAHPVFDADAIAAQRRHAEIDGAGGVHYAGAYWGYGFHEDGLRSALAVCERLVSGSEAG
jgi:predicted NAD/FAD-binding protein